MAEGIYIIIEIEKYLKSPIISKNLEPEIMNKFLILTKKLPDLFKSLFDELAENFVEKS